MASKKRAHKKSLSPPYCEWCGYDKFVTQHRIRPGRKGGLYVISNVCSLCHNCHVEAENGLISPYELQKIVFARLKKEMKKK